MRTTGFRMPGTAAEAMIADQMTQFGAVRYCANARSSGQHTPRRKVRWLGKGVRRTLRSFVGECRSCGMTLTLSTRPVRSYASRKVRLPCVQKEA